MNSKSLPGIGRDSSSGQIDAQRCELGHSQIQGSRCVGQGKDQADLTGTRIDLHLLGNADEASVVVVRKLDLLFQHVQAVKVSAFLGADSSHILAIAFRNHLCSNGRVFNDSHFHILQFFQEVATLSERLFVGEDLLDIGEGSSRLCHQIVADAQTDAFGDMEVVVLHQVVDGTDGTVRAVFDGIGSNWQRPFSTALNTPSKLLKYTMLGTSKSFSQAA